MLKHLWGEPSQAHFESLILATHNHYSRSIQFSKQTEVETARRTT